MWFFRRTDTPLPEITAAVEARRVACPEGGGPHRLEVVTELDRHFAARGVEGAFVLYDAAGRRFVRSAPQGTGTRHAPGASFELPALLLALQAGLASPEGPFDWEELASSVPAARWRSAIREYGNRAFTGGERGFWADGALRISADEQVYWLVDVLRDRAVPAARGGADAAVDPVEGLRSLTLLDDRGGARLFGSIAPDPREEEGRGWAVGWVERGEQDLFVFATYLSVRGAEATGREVPEGIVRAILEELEVLPPVPPER